MAKRLLNMRVRPPRSTILINQNASESDLLLAFDFLSQSWGGRFGQIIPVNESDCDPLTEFRLGRSRPDFVYGVRLDDEKWRKHVLDACQPRKYVNLNSEFLKNPTIPDRDLYISVGYALECFIAHRHPNISARRSFWLVNATKGSAWSVYCAAMYGVHFLNLPTSYYDHFQQLEEDTVEGFFRIAQQFASQCLFSWLDLTSIALHPGTDWHVLPPTIVLVRDLIADLSLFWNLRAASETSTPAWVFPLPINQVEDVRVSDWLKQWLGAFSKYGNRPNYCIVTSQSVDEESCQSFAEKLQHTLAGTNFEFVDFEPPSNRIPETLPFEYMTTQTVDVEGRQVAFQPPQLKALKLHSTSSAWFVDLVSDLATKRAPLEMQYPPGHVVQSLLNGPCPPRFEYSLIPRTGDGRDSINIRCSLSDKLINIHLPSANEVFSETLREYGAQPIQDEKRSCYLPVIKRFGGLYKTAAAFTGQTIEVLSALLRSPKTIDEIRGACRLGKGELPDESYERQLGPFLDRLSDRMRRVAISRYRRYASKANPDESNIQSLLEHWARRRIVTRFWRIGPCNQCKQRDWMEHLNIQKPIICRHCGHRITLQPHIQIGYRVHDAVRHAFDEGIVPIVLTGRFLRNFTGNGFFWLPGLKYETSSLCSDIDIVACCDGHLVFCECKSRSRSAGEKVNWELTIEKFINLARLCERCHGSLAVLAAQVDAFPTTTYEKLDSELRGGVRYLLLNKTDLDVGHREEEGTRRWLRLGDFIDESFPEKPIIRKGAKPRTIQFGSGLTQGITVNSDAP